MAKAKEKVAQEPSMSLVALNLEYQNIALELSRAGGELTPEIERDYDVAIAALCEKADAYGFVREKLEAERAFWAFQEEKCYAAKKAIENTIERLEGRMKFVLPQLPGKELVGLLYRFFLANAADTIQINEAELPDDWKKTEFNVVPDKERIKLAVKNGEVIPGVTVKTDNTSLRKGRPK